ncbi:MAG TPA: hypothetical protein VF192_09825 [Longimicrobiales bacterium]
MDVQGRTVLLLGGSGLVGMAVARRLLAHAPGAVVISALRREEAEQAVAELTAEGVPSGTRVVAEWGNIFLPEPLKDRSREEVLSDPASRALLLDDLLGELTDDVVRRSTLGVILARHQPHLVVDCVNTATAFAYQNVFASGLALRAAAHAGRADVESVERHLATLHLPQLIRHVQIALEAMRRAGTLLYIKVGTSGTGGMGLNIPFTHSEERPSRTLLAKAGVAGAHTLLLYLMARTPGAPAAKEIKPTAAVSWKAIGYGQVRRGGRPIPRCDAARALPLAEAFGTAAADAHRVLGGALEGVYLDAGENGLFSLAEFETLTALGLMEYITPEEIADDVIREIRGFPTGRDIVAALDASTSGPTYRAGLLRQVALERMEELERQHGSAAVAYEMLGPPRLSKLLFEGAILGRLFRDLPEAAALDPDAAAARALALIESEDELRVHALSIGIPILLPDGDRLLRGAEVKVAPEPGQSPDDARLAERGWIDLRPANWERWRKRCSAMLRELETAPGPDCGSRSDAGLTPRRLELRPARLAAWVLRTEDQGERLRR